MTPVAGPNNYLLRYKFETIHWNICNSIIWESPTLYVSDYIVMVIMHVYFSLDVQRNLNKTGLFSKEKGSPTNYIIFEIDIF